MTIRERIISYLDFKGVSKYKFYKSTGLSNGFLDKEGAIGSDKCEIICSRYPDLNPEWMLIGEGEMIKAFNLYKEDFSTQVDFVGEDENSIKALIDKIIELTEENTILKVENNVLKRKEAPKPYISENIIDNIAAEPK